MLTTNCDHSVSLKCLNLFRRYKVKNEETDRRTVRQTKRQADRQAHGDNHCLMPPVSVGDWGIRLNQKLMNQQSERRSKSLSTRSLSTGILCEWTDIHTNEHGWFIKFSKRYTNFCVPPSFDFVRKSPTYALWTATPTIHIALNCWSIKSMCDSKTP